MTFLKLTWTVLTSQKKPPLFKKLHYFYLFSNGLDKCTSEARTAKISKLSSRLRRELHQLRRTLRVHRYRHPLVVSTAVALLKAAQQDVPASVDSVIESSKTR